MWREIINILQAYYPEPDILNNPYLAVVFFATYSFMGWLLETVYRSAQQRQFVNAGFLYGPFVSLYGFGAFFVLGIDHFLHTCPIPLKIIPFAIFATILEYITGYLFERLFGLKLWDYSQNKFNLHGRVCLLFSLLWSILALVFVTVIHPITSFIIAQIDESVFRPMALVFASYICADFIFSIFSLASFRNAVRRLYREYLSLNSDEREAIFKRFRRPLRAFPHLGRYIDRSINHDIKTRASRALATMRSKIAESIEGRRPMEQEFHNIVRDIYENNEFKKLKGFYHHNSSIYEHAMAVSYLSYKICKVLGLDYHSAARGAMMHDFFLYDWRTHDEPDLPRGTFHGPAHPKIALTNAQKHFSLNPIERDIIIKHMWPLTPVPPRFRESFVVTFADKYLSSKEFFDEFRKRRQKNIGMSGSPGHANPSRASKKRRRKRTSAAS